MIRMILLAVVLGAVYFLWKAITEQKATLDAKDAEKEADSTLPPPGAATETAECPLCRAYVPVNAEGGCGRDDCPIPALAEAMAEDAEAKPKG